MVSTTETTTIWSNDALPMSAPNEIITAAAANSPCSHRQWVDQA
jgi:hypothetical protein